MEIKFKKKIIKIGESFGFIVPKQYVEDSHIIEDKDYEVILREVGNAE